MNGSIAAIALAGLALIAAPATGAPVFAVDNAAAGVGWRAAPDPAAPLAAGEGVARGTLVRVHCHRSAALGPGRGDTLWLRASWASGPGGGSGWINGHFVADGAPIHRPAAGVRRCARAPATPAAPAPAARTLTRACSGAWIDWARYAEGRRGIELRLRPTRRAWAAMGGGRLAPRMWNAYFACVGRQEGLGGLTGAEWRSLWLQHRCHEFFGGALRRLTGPTFDYSTAIPDRGSLARSLVNRCN